MTIKVFEVSKTVSSYSLDTSQQVSRGKAGRNRKLPMKQEAKSDLF